MKKLISALVLAAMFHSGVALAAVNVNTAGPAQLTALDGIGPAKADAIIQYREAHDNFASLDGLTAVSGIGEKTVEGLRGDATVGSDSMASESSTSE